ncbi:MAG: ATP-binding protein [Ilumatobacteraceae bacterium]
MTSGGNGSLGTVADTSAARLVFDVSSLPEEVAVARHAVVAFLTSHGVSSVVVDDMELVTSELVTNAIIHPAAHDLVHIEVGATDTVELLVSNVGPADAIPAIDEWQPAPPFATSGRGLGIVRRLCDDVDVEQVGDRAVVTCRRRLPDGGGSP